MVTWDRGMRLFVHTMAQTSTSERHASTCGLDEAVYAA